MPQHGYALWSQTLKVRQGDLALRATHGEDHPHHPAIRSKVSVTSTSARRMDQLSDGSIGSEESIEELLSYTQTKNINITL